MTFNCILRADGQRVDAATLIGTGTDGFIIRQGRHVLKIPKLVGTLMPDGEVIPHSDNSLYLDHLENEKRIYERLRKAPGVAACVECTSNGMLLECYRKGNLRDHISREEPPSMSQRWEWVCQAANTIAGCHERGVLVFDIALRNFLLADDLTLRLIDFANSELLPEGANVSEANVDGCTARLDLLHLANIIYSIMTWQAFSISCDRETEWPAPKCMPDVTKLKFGHLIRKCWLKQYTAVEGLVQDVRLCAGACFFAYVP